MLPSINPVVKSIPEALSIFVNQIVYDKESRGERVYTFSLGEAFFNVPRFEVSDEDFRRGYHYSNSMGQPALRKKIAGLYHDCYKVSADP
jgi:aspartate aminotransferase/aminotransferase